jgi:hypothetical protein
MDREASSFAVAGVVDVMVNIYRGSLSRVEPSIWARLTQPYRASRFTYHLFPDPATGTAHRRLPLLTGQASSTDRPLDLEPWARCLFGGE